MLSQEERDQRLFDRIAAHYGRKDIVRSSALARKSQLLAAMQPIFEQAPELGTVVDIGCGVGAPALHLDGRYRHYIGIDQSVEMIEAARLFHRDRNLVEFFAENVRMSALPDDTADVILSIGALHHMIELDEVMGQLVRLAKPGAFFVVIEPQNGNPIIQMMRWIRGKVDKGYSIEQVFFAEQELVTLFSEHRITNLNITFQGFTSPPFAQVVINPQALSVPLSRLAIRFDDWLYRHLRGPLQKLSFNIVLTGTFPIAGKSIYEK